MRVFFCKIPINKQDTNVISTNCSSDKLLTTTIVIGMPKNLNAGTLFLYFKEQIWLTNRNCYGKNKLF